MGHSKPRLSRRIPVDYKNIRIQHYIKCKPHQKATVRSFARDWWQTNGLTLKGNAMWLYDVLEVKFYALTPEERLQVIDNEQEFWQDVRGLADYGKKLKKYW